MKKYIIIICLILNIFSYAEIVFYNDVNKGLDYIYNGEYKKALIIADSINSIYKEYAVGDYLKIAVFSTYMSDFETDTLKDSMAFYFKKIMDYNKEYPYNLFFIGGAYLNHATILTINGQYISAINASRKAKNYFEKSITMDSTLYDAYLGLGLVHYFLDKFASKLPFKKMTYSGIKEVELAADSGLFSKIPAYNMLALIYSYEKNKEKSTFYINLLREQFPENRMFLFTEYKIYTAFNDTEKCINILNELAEHIEKEQPHTYYNLLFVYSELCELYFNKKDYKNAELYANKTKDYEWAIKIDKRIKKYIYKAKKILKKL